MRKDSDEDALSWGEEPDATHVDARERAARDAHANPANAVSVQSGAAQASSPMLVVYGVFGGAYLIYVFGWVIAVQRSTVVLPDILAAFMYQMGEFLAIASPALWLVAVLVATRDRRPLLRLVWLTVGLLLLAPWPFFLAGLG